MGVFRHQDCVTGQPTGSAVWLDGSCISCKLQKGINISVGAVLGMELFFISVKKVVHIVKNKSAIKGFQMNTTKVV